MSFVWSLVWGLAAIAVMSVTMKYYLPRLSERARLTTSEALARSDGEGSQPDAAPGSGSRISDKPLYVLLMLVLCGGYSAWCGYVAAEHAVSVIGMLKMMLAMAVLSCVFITDMELMMIPNLCSIILLAGRAVTIVLEFIWLRDEAVAWLLNSVIALVVSLLLLLLMTKVTRGGLGLGDVKLFSSLGFLCGIRAVCFTLMFAFFICAVASTGLLLTQKKKLKDSLPLGPFIWAGYGVTVLLSIM